MYIHNILSHYALYIIYDHICILYTQYRSGKGFSGRVRGRIPLVVLHRLLQCSPNRSTNRPTDHVSAANPHSLEDAPRKNEGGRKHHIDTWLALPRLASPNDSVPPWGWVLHAVSAQQNQ